MVEVFTDKLVAKIPATHTGIVKSINFSIDDICLVGHPLLTIETEGEAEATTIRVERNPEVPKIDMKEAEKQSEPLDLPIPAQVIAQAASYKREGPVLANPSARFLACLNKLDIASVQGSGPKGRITKGDVVTFIEDGFPQKSSATTVLHTKATQVSPFVEFEMEEKRTGFQNLE